MVLLVAQDELGRRQEPDCAGKCDSLKDCGLYLKSLGKSLKVLCRGKGMAWLGSLLGMVTHATDEE